MRRTARPPRRRRPWPAVSARREGRGAFKFGCVLAGHDPGQECSIAHTRLTVPVPGSPNNRQHRSCAAYLPGSRRPDQEASLRDLGAKLGVFVGALKEIDDLHELELGAVAAGNVIKGHAGVRHLLRGVTAG
eukprot:233311-Chlamydomonas_euryale.AAC.2